MAIIKSHLHVVWGDEKERAKRNIKKVRASSASKSLEEATKNTHGEGKKMAL